MNVNELMIGDFVSHEIYGNAIIETIDNDFGDNPSIRLISENIKQKTGYKYGYCWCDLNEIFPIPLTPEILEKNGFEYNLDRGVYMLGIIFQVKPERNGMFSISICGCSQLINTVHKLQHALKLCEIEKNIII